MVELSNVLETNAVAIFNQRHKSLPAHLKVSEYPHDGIEDPQASRFCWEDGGNLSVRLIPFISPSRGAMGW